MRGSALNAKARRSIWTWLFWGLGFYLVLELGPFLIAAWLLKKTAGELAGPYLAFAAPWVIFVPLIWWLRRWEETGASPKRLARGWGLSMALFGIAVEVAVFYSGVELHLMDQNDAVGGFIVALLLGIPILYLGMYYKSLRTISSRAAEKLGSTQAE